LHVCYNACLLISSHSLACFACHLSILLGWHVRASLLLGEISSFLFGPASGGTFVPRIQSPKE
jgi:hypothetical protein